MVLVGVRRQEHLDGLPASRELLRCVAKKATTCRLAGIGTAPCCPQIDQNRLKPKTSKTHSIGEGGREGQGLACQPLQNVL